MLFTPYRFLILALHSRALGRTSGLVWPSLRTRCRALIALPCHHMDPTRNTASIRFARRPAVKSGRLSIAASPATQPQPQGICGPGGRPRRLNSSAAETPGSNVTDAGIV